MNAAKAIEQAFAATVRKYGEIGESVIIRCWQSLKDDDTWNADPDRAFPCLDIRCSPPEPDPAAMYTLIGECALLCASKADDDLDHAFISGFYGAVQDVCDRLYAGCMGATDHAAVYAFFIAELAARIAEQGGTATLTVGGLTFGSPLAPFDDGGLNEIGLAMRVHYSRSDF